MNHLSIGEYSTRPPDIEGRSKRLWVRDDGTCIVEMIPSLRSFTFKRDELIPATARLRLDFYERASACLEKYGVPTVYRRRLGDTSYLADYAPAPPFEVIVKNRCVGSTLRKYPNLFPEGHEFKPPVIKFDFRIDPEDQPIGEDYLRAYGVDVERFRTLALDCNMALGEWLAPWKIWDFCVIIGTGPDGRLTINSEVSPDCMRLRDEHENPLDKDLFRQGASPERIVDAWTELINRLPK
jgi:phosphoribosylaminoimidazole-succinocarboxamide synthase